MSEARSFRRYPGSDLRDCVEMIGAVYKANGVQWTSADLVAEALGMSPRGGATGRKIGALAAFGLLEKGSEGYRISDLAKRVLRPLPGELEEALREAFLNVPLYRDVLDRYRPDGRLPDGLPRFLDRVFSVAVASADYAAKVLLDSGNYARILDGSEILGSDEKIVPTEPQKPVEVNPGQESKVTVDEPPTPDPKLPNVDTSLISIELPNPRAVFTTKSKLTSKDKARLLSWIDKVLKAQLEFLIEEEVEDSE